MLIDWFTVGAQALNFIILVWLLKRFLYKPILDAVDAREARIAAALADADAKAAEAQRERDAFQRRNEQVDQERASLTAKAMDEARATRQRLLNDARADVDVLRTSLKDALLADALTLNQSICCRTQAEVFAIARKVLADLAGASLEERMADVFARRLRAMDGPAKEGFAAAIRTAPAPPLVRSTFELGREPRAVIQSAFNETFATYAQLRFETAPGQICGIELATNGQKVAWTIENYMVSLEKCVSELLHDKDKPEPNPEAAPQ